MKASLYDYTDYIALTSDTNENGKRLFTQMRCRFAPVSVAIDFAMLAEAERMADELPPPDRMRNPIRTDRGKLIMGSLGELAVMRVYPDFEKITGSRERYRRDLRGYGITVEVKTQERTVPNVAPDFAANYADESLHEIADAVCCVSAFKKAEHYVSLTICGFVDFPDPDNLCWPWYTVEKNSIGRTGKNWRCKADCLNVLYRNLLPLEAYLQKRKSA